MSRTINYLTTIGRISFSYYRTALPKICLINVRPLCMPSSFHESFIKYSVGRENANAHNTMVNDPMYSDTIVNPYDCKDWPSVTDEEFNKLITQNYQSKSVDEICEDFFKISIFVSGKQFSFLDQLFDPIREQLISVASQLSDDQLLKCLKLLSLWNVKIAKDPVYFKFWSALDKQCIERFRKWSLNKTLLYMDHWYMARMARMSNFVWMAVRKLARKPSRLTPKQLVQMMFYANTSRKFTQSLPMFDIEHELNSYFDDFTIKELGIIALGFFKTQTPIRNLELIDKIYSAVLSNFNNINSIELAAFLKIFRYCTKPKNYVSMLKLMDSLVDKVDQVNILCCVHIALLGTNLLIKHDELLNKISQRMVNEISETRIKDLERLVLVLSMLNHNPQTKPCIFDAVVNELRNTKRKEEFECFPRSYVYTLSYLALNKIYPYDCISKSLTSEALHKCFGKTLNRFTISRDILSLNNGLLIECPDYTGPFLPVKLNESCNNHGAWHIPTTTESNKMSHSDKFISKLYRELSCMFIDESFLHVCYPLPHHSKPDMLFCIDPSGKPIDLPESIKSRTAFHEFSKPPNIGKWFAIVPLVRNSVLFNSSEPTGQTLCKIRQLKKIGYEPIMFSHKEFSNDINVHNQIREKLKSYGVDV
ncbi:uncharacterized protein LOC126901202 [Daktulosphaira vitifoliae]|uniref:uncharacterized protein LOC126901202 n=1 Tax=Daktulosphaira vitifoliae TaxID=58002 RepID=UPI0021AAB1A8|nr:uncharacterized protein LOC126901202 [Daktulosphaira vitifoliae]